MIVVTPQSTTTSWLQIELIGFAGRERERHVGLGHLRLAHPLPPPSIATDGIVAALVAQPAQVLAHADQRQPLARGRRSFSSKSWLSAATWLPSFGSG
jgi:hypothetical protein